MNKLPIIEKAGGDQGMHFGNNSTRPPSLTIFLICVVGLFLILTVRLFQLTVVKGSYYRRLSEENRIKEVVIEAKRGEVIDRKGVVIASSASPVSGLVKDRFVSNRVVALGDSVGHILGYMQLADKNDLNNDLCLNKLRLGDSTGKKGVEKLYECELRGINGRKLLELNAQGKPLKTLGQIEPVDGKIVQLSIDQKLQQRTQELFSQNISSQSAVFPKQEFLDKAAVVALEPKTGRTLLLYSNPTFDPNDFNLKNSERVADYLKDKKQPLFNRVTEGAYPPGSIFKLVIATGALEEKAMKPDTIIEDTGQITAGPLKFGNWYFLQYGKTEGEVNMVKAIKRSNDIYFYRAGERLGVTHIKTWAEKFGFGKITKFPLLQSEGLIPSPFWKEEILKEQWYLGDTYNLSIGQGYMLTTPIQIAQATAVFANGGNLCSPLIKQDDRPNCTKMPMSNETLQTVREGMKQACDTGGTGWPFFEFSVKNKRVNVGCKTGTAESHGVGKPEPHAWFTVFAPFDNPEIVLTILVENGGEGSTVAAPIAKELLTTYFEEN